MALGGEAFGKWLGHEGGALINGISTFIKGTPVSSLALLPCEDTGRRHPSMNQELTLTRHQICRHLDLGLPSLQAVRNKFLLLIRLPVHGILVWQPEWIKTTGCSGRTWAALLLHTKETPPKDSCSVLCIWARVLSRQMWLWATVIWVLVLTYLHFYMLLEKLKKYRKVQRTI